MVGECCKPFTIILIETTERMLWPVRMINDTSYHLPTTVPLRGPKALAANASYYYKQNGQMTVSEYRKVNWKEQYNSSRVMKKKSIYGTFFCGFCIVLKVREDWSCHHVSQWQLVNLAVRNNKPVLRGTQHITFSIIPCRLLSVIHRLFLRMRRKCYDKN